MMNENKIVLLGDASTGKTALLSRWADGGLSRVQAPTVGAAYRMVMFQHKGTSYNLHIWDTAGQETYRSTSPIYCRDARAAMLVFDLTNHESFENLGVWKEMLSNESDAAFIIVGNKSDLVDERAVDVGEARSYAKALGVHYIETSALTGDMVDEAFTDVATLAVSNADVDEVTHKINVGENPSEKGKCC